MPRRKVNDSLLPPEVEQEILAQLKKIYGDPSKPRRQTAKELTRLRATAQWASLLGRAAANPAPPQARSGKPLSESDMERLQALPRATESDGWAYNSPFVIGFHEYEVGKRGDQYVYRKPGASKRGGALTVPPFYRKLLERQRDFETERAKVARRFALKSAREAAHAARVERIRALAQKYSGRGSIKRIAHEVGCSVRTVERALTIK